MENYSETKVLSLAGKDDLNVECDSLSLHGLPHCRDVSEHEFLGRNERNERVILGELQSDENTPSLPVHTLDNNRMSLQKGEEKEDNGRYLIPEEEKASDHDGPTAIRGPGIHDVLLGRGAHVYNHEGNISFRKLVKDYKAQYFNASKNAKPNVAWIVVHLWHHLSPPGRFLRPVSKGKWIEVDNHDARKKASQCLRERKKERVQPICQEQERVILSEASDVHQPASLGNAFVTHTANPPIIMTLPEMHQSIQQNIMHQQFHLHRLRMLAMCTFAPGIVDGAPMMRHFQVPQPFVFGSNIPQRIRQLENIQNNNTMSQGVMYPSTTHMRRQSAKVGEKKIEKKNGGNQSM